MDPKFCVYLRSETGKSLEDGRHVRECLIHGHCVTSGEATPLASCAQCKNRLSIKDKKLSREFLDHLFIIDRTRQPTTALRNLLGGRTTFLVCGGPSAKELPLHSLNQRGLWSMAVNNMAGMFWPNAFVCSDPPSKFHDGIWRDPSVMKFVPTPKLSGKRGRIREKMKEPVPENCDCKTSERSQCKRCKGTGIYQNYFRQLVIDGNKISITDCPNVWGFGRRAWIQTDDTFFLDTDAAWGNHNAGVEKTGLEKTVCTMLLGLRLLYYLGSRRIYLVGVDFNMKPNADLKENYAFGEKRDQGAVSSNNSQFQVVNKWLCRIVKEGVFKRFGLEIFNCNPLSALRAFEHVPFDLAVQDALKGFPEQPFDLEDWYLK